MNHEEVIEYLEEQYDMVLDEGVCDENQDKRLEALRLAIAFYKQTQNKVK